MAVRDGDDQGEQTVGDMGVVGVYYLYLCHKTDRNEMDSRGQ